MSGLGFGSFGGWRCFFLCWCRFRCDQFTGAAFGFDFRFGGGAEGVSGNGEFTGEFAVAENFDTVAWTVRKAGVAEDFFVHARAFVKAVEGFQIDGQIASGVAGVVEAALGNAANEGHLAAFETDADGAAGAGSLAFATAPAGFAMAAGFALAEALAAMLGTGTRL